MLELLIALSLSLSKLSILLDAYATYETPQEIIMATTSAYSDIETCKGKCINAIGKESKISDVACPRNIKLGTRIEIDGITYFCNDRTNIRHDGIYDIFMGYGTSSYQNALQYGVQMKSIKIFTK